MNREDCFYNWEELINNWIQKDVCTQESLINHVGNHKRPSMYKIWLINDNKIPSDLYINIFEDYFRLSSEAMIEIFNKLRREGQVSCGTFTREIAENTIMKVIDFSQINGHPLKCIMCKDNDYAFKKS